MASRRASGSDGAPARKKRKTSNKQIDTTPATFRRATRSMTTDAARRAVFETSELLENIISYLPAIGILTKVQRVSHQWQVVVRSSPTIQTRLWMRPKAAKPVSPARFTTEIDPFVYNGLSYRGRSNFHTSGLIRVLESQVPAYPDRTVFNPLLTAAIVQEEPRFTFVSIRRSPADNAVRAVFHSKMLEQKTRQSWLDMYLTEPPITVVQVKAYWPERQGCFMMTRHHLATVRDEAGLTCGAIVDVMEKMSAPIVPSGLSSRFISKFCPSVWFAAEDLVDSYHIRIVNIE